VAKKKEESSVMVWSDNTGTYKLGYSQYLQKELLKTDRLLLIAVVILIVMLIAAFWYGFLLIQRIDELNVLGKLATKAGFVAGFVP
jgi:hypothetical protein